MDDENFYGLLSNLFHELDNWEDPIRHNTQFVYMMWCSIFVYRPHELPQLWPTNQVHCVLIILCHFISTNTYILIV